MKSLRFSSRRLPGLGSARPGGRAYRLEKGVLANGGAVTMVPRDPYCGRVQSGHDIKSIGDTSCP
jgi:hypothetical protein